MLTDEEKDPVLEPETTASEAGEGSTTGDSADTTAVPPAEEDPAETTNEETAEAKSGAKPVEQFEIFLEGEEADAALPAPKDSAAWARMRKAEQEAKARAAELERELQALRQPIGATDPGPEPTIESCDYDEPLYKQRLRAWDKAVETHGAHQAKQVERASQQQQEARGRVDAYNVARVEALAKYPGYESSEQTVGAALTPDRLDVLVKNAGSGLGLARVVHALGQRPELLEKFAKETDRDRLVAELVKLEVSMKERKKGTQAPPPERSPRGTGATGAENSTLERLREKAAKSGDYTEVNAWKRKQREQQEQPRRKK